MSQGQGGYGLDVAFANVFVGSWSIEGAPPAFQTGAAVRAGSGAFLTVLDTGLVPPPGAPAVTGNGAVDFGDIVILLAAWAPCA